jgi:mannitol/fructose-specific phosphotransferase system IIA component
VGDEHINVLARLGQVVEDEAATRSLVEATSAAVVVECLSRASAESEAT